MGNKWLIYYSETVGDRYKYYYCFCRSEDKPTFTLLERKVLTRTIKGSLAFPHRRAPFGSRHDVLERFHSEPFQRALLRTQNQGLHLKQAVKSFTQNPV